MNETKERIKSRAHTAQLRAALAAMKKMSDEEKKAYWTGRLHNWPIQTIIIPEPTAIASHAGAIAALAGNFDDDGDASRGRHDDRIPPPGDKQGKEEAEWEGAFSKCDACDKRAHKGCCTAGKGRSQHDPADLTSPNVPAPRRLVSSKWPTALRNTNASSAGGGTGGATSPITPLLKAEERFAGM